MPSLRGRSIRWPHVASPALPVSVNIWEWRRPYVVISNRARWAMRPSSSPALMLVPSPAKFFSSTRAITLWGLDRRPLRVPCRGLGQPSSPLLFVLAIDGSYTLAVAAYTAEARNGPVHVAARPDYQTAGIVSSVRVSWNRWVAWQIWLAC